MLLFSMSIFASGFETSDLETKEKTEMIQDISFDVVSIVEDFQLSSNVDTPHQNISFDVVSIVEDFQLSSNVDTPHQSNLKVLCLRTFKERLKERAKENRKQFITLNKNKINSFYLQAYRINGYVGWNC